MGKNSFKYLIAALTILVMVSCGSMETDPARKVLDESVRKMGGMGKLTGWNSLVEKGTLTSNWPGWGKLNAACTHYTLKPGKMLLDQDYSANDHPFYFVYTYNGGQAWAEVNMGIRQNQRYTDMLEKMMTEIDGIPYFMADFDSFYIAAEVPDDSILTADRFTRVGCVKGDRTVFFDICNETRMPLRKIDIGASGETHTLMDDFRNTSGRTVPYHVTVYQNGAKTSEFVWDTIEYDTAIDPDIFEKNRPAQEES